MWRAVISMQFIILSIFLNAIVNAQEGHHSPIETTIASTVATVVVGSEHEVACTAADCNERGSCFGTKAMPLCLCQLGFAGVRCQDTYCDSARDCSGRGWCMGTSSQFSCLCNLGFAGERCERETAPAGQITIATPAPPGASHRAPESGARPEQSGEQVHSPRHESGSRNGFGGESAESGGQFSGHNGMML
ncbi:sushi, nidogen and EGF-like domain-containing protein 1 [Ditylenchus destructor]|uniref:Sushi, nidogen and EGF-like domain-containing protein 1 n=1 Tax=Ditylenchus destructor TaxID=166010 RepID=A0AAD4N9M5_9BILA|nr:sushi, nidogen and EGF-like domain-containing protein 1 [Ditylenchus destructor]